MCVLRILDLILSYVIVVVIVDSCFFLLEVVPFLSNLLPSNLITDWSWGGVLVGTAMDGSVVERVGGYWLGW